MFIHVGKMFSLKSSSTASPPIHNKPDTSRVVHHVYQYLIASQLYQLDVFWGPKCCMLFIFTAW